MASVPGGLRDRDGHRVQLPGIGDQIPPGRRRGAVYAQGVRNSLRDVLGGVRRDVFGHHSASTASRAFAVEPVQWLRLQLGHWGFVVGGAVVHDAAGHGQPPRRRRERQAERRPHSDRDHRPDAGDLRRAVGVYPRRRCRLLPGGRVRHRRGQERVHGRHHRDVVGVLRDGGVRGLGEYGRRDQGPGADLPECC